MAAHEGGGSKAGETAPRPREDPADVLPGSSAAAYETGKREPQEKDSHDDDFDRLDDDDDEFVDVSPPPPPPQAPPSTSYFRLEPSEEALAEASSLKAAGNEAFGQGDFGEAVAAYGRALDKLGDEVEREEEDDGEEGGEEKDDEEENEKGDNEEKPSTTSEEATELGATLHANLSASYLKLEKFLEARDSADAALRLLSSKKKKEGDEKKKALLLAAKALLRRAAAAAGEGDFASAAADARAAAEQAKSAAAASSSSSSASAFLLEKQASAAAEDYGRRAAEAAERARDEVVGKLKELGNSLLGRFGLSLDSFAAEKDPETGAYSIKFNQSGGGGGGGGGGEAKPLGRT